MLIETISKSAMGIKYTLFLIACVAATVVITLKTASLIPGLSGVSTAISHQDGQIILKELKEVRSTLERLEKQVSAGRRPPTPKTASAATKNRPTLGNPNAKITVVEFTDYQCPFCYRFEKTTFKQLKKNYIDNGKVRWVVLDMPLSFHKDAMLASLAAHCAAEQDKFWELRELLFQNQKKLKPEHIASYAKQVNLETEAFNQCINSNRYDEDIKRDIAQAEKQRISGTPTFVIGKTTADIIKGKRIVGAQAYKVFSDEIEAQLKAATM